MIVFFFFQREPTEFVLEIQIKMKIFFFFLGNQRLYNFLCIFYLNHIRKTKIIRVNKIPFVLISYHTAFVNCNLTSVLEAFQNCEFKFLILEMRLTLPASISPS